MREVRTGMSSGTVFPGNGIVTGQPRSYRKAMGHRRFVSLTVCLKESDLWIGVDPESFAAIGETALRSCVLERLTELRSILERYGAKRPEFFSSLTPIAQDEGAHILIQEMISAAEAAGTGPMAGVAGAAAGDIGAYLNDLWSPRELVIENGGDLYIQAQQEVVVSVFAGSSALSRKIQVHIPASVTPVGVCTSSGTFGHSFSFGAADAVMAAAKSPILADALATSFCSRVKTPADVDAAAAEMEGFDDLISGVIIMGDKAGLFGDLEISFAR